jgi:N-acetylmuramoyl-L-alanine amidase
MIVGIDPGHGGDNHGASHNGVTEERYVLELGLALRPILIGLGMGCEMSRNGNETVSFENRAIRLGRANFVLVLHVNAAPATSAKDLRCYHLEGNLVSASSAHEIERVAPAIIAPKVFIPTIASKNSPDTNRCYNTLACYGPKPAVLVELFFCTHEETARWAQTPYGRGALLMALAAGAVNAWQLLETIHAPVAPSTQLLA